MTSNDELIDRIFRDPETRHGLKMFGSADFAKLELSQNSDRILVKCFVTNRNRPAKPEEIIRQLMARRLVDTLGYPLDRLAVEVAIKMGSGVHPKKADLIVYTDAAKLTPHIIIEVKKPRRKDGLEQLNSYMNATGVYYGAWANGNDAVYQLRNKPNLFEELIRLPAAHESLDDVKQPITKGELQPIEDLRDEVEYLEDTVLANAGVSTFEEIFKLIFTKLYDEFTKADDEPVSFRTTTAAPAEQYKRLNSLFHQASEEWSDIFGPHEDLGLTPEALLVVASALQGRRFLDADLDVIDAAFEYMINPEQKGDKGQYFTPRAVVKMCVRMMNPKPSERVLDPACGPGGFLVHALHWVTEQSLRHKYKSNLDKKKYDYASSRLFGIDFDARLMRVAKAMMLIAGDGRTNIFRVNSLDEREWLNRSDTLQTVIRDGGFDIVMTNPPFAGSITQPEILGRYELSYKGDSSAYRRANKMTRDVLFIERCMGFLKPGGRMAIVLPQGNFNNTTSQFIRDWIFQRARVLAVVGLHGNTFKPFTGTKTSVLFVQKRRPNEVVDPNERIFMAVNDRPVKDNTGAYIYHRLDGAFTLDGDGKRVVDHDLDEIANAFVVHAKSTGLSFWAE